MTVAGDVGSATTGGTAPMKKIGAEVPLRRKNPLKKQEEKLKSFREYAIDEARKSTKPGRPEYIIKFNEEEYFKSFSDKAINTRLKSKKFLKDSKNKDVSLYMQQPNGKLKELDIEGFKF